MDMIKFSLLLFVLCNCAKASVHEYKGTSFIVNGDAFMLHGGSEGLYASHKSSSNSGNDEDDSSYESGHAFIRFEKITFRRPQDKGTHENKTNGPFLTIKAIVFDVQDQETIGGSVFGGQSAICCTSDLAKTGSCTQGTVIYRHSSTEPYWPRVLSAFFNEGDLIATLPSETIKITKSGMYSIYFVYCDPTLEGLTIEGKTIWKNPTGYLPGRMGPMMKCYGFISLAYLILGILWFSQYARFWTEVMPLQNCITLVIALGMLEMTIWYFDYVEFNETGLRSVGITFWAVTFGVVKRTLSCVLILLVSMGFGVVRPTLGGLTSKVALLGGTFFVASEVLELVENVGTVSDVSGKSRMFFILPVAILDALFIVWIFTSLSKTLKKLQARRLSTKLDIYRKFSKALSVTVIVSIAWTGFEYCFRSKDEYGQRWQNAWIIPSMWHLLSFILLCVICTLWAPSHNSARYAYSNDGSEEFDKDDMTNLTKLAPFYYKDSWSFSVSTNAKMLPDRPIPNSNDTEEDKRE